MGLITTSHLQDVTTVDLATRTFCWLIN